MENSILLVDDEAQVLNALWRALMDENLDVCTAGNAEDALRMLEGRRFKVIVCDERMPGMSGAELLSLASVRHPEMVRIMLTGHATLEAAMRAVNTGEIYRFFAKPWNDLELILSIRSAVEKYDLEMENRRLLAMLRTQSKYLESLERRYPGITGVERSADGGFVIPELADEEVAALLDECRVGPGGAVDSGRSGNKV